MFLNEAKKITHIFAVAAALTCSLWAKPAVKAPDIGGHISPFADTTALRPDTALNFSLHSPGRLPIDPKSVPIDRTSKNKLSQDDERQVVTNGLVMTDSIRFSDGSTVLSHIVSMDGVQNTNFTATPDAEFTNLIKRSSNFTRENKLGSFLLHHGHGKKIFNLKLAGTKYDSLHIVGVIENGKVKLIGHTDLYGTKKKITHTFHECFLQMGARNEPFKLFLNKKYRYTSPYAVAMHLPAAQNAKQLETSIKAQIPDLLKAKSSTKEKRVIGDTPIQKPSVKIAALRLAA